MPDINLRNKVNFWWLLWNLYIETTLGQETCGLYLLVVFISRSILYMIWTVYFERGGLKIQVVFLDSGHIIQVSLYFFFIKILVNRFQNWPVIISRLLAMWRVHPFPLAGPLMTWWQVKVYATPNVYTMGFFFLVLQL